MRRSGNCLLPLLILLGCGSPADEDPGDEPVDSGTVDTGATDTDTDTGTDTVTVPVPDFACYSELETDWGGNGVPDVVELSAYDEGLLHLGDLPIHWRIDAGGGGGYPDGAPDEIREWDYDDDGNRTDERRDTDGDGAWDYTSDHTFDALGNEVAVDIDSDGDGLYDELWTYTYDGDLLTRIDGDTNADLVIDYVAIQTWDEAGLRTGYTIDFGADGSVELTYTYDYDAYDRLVLIDGRDGAGDLAYHYTVVYDDTSTASGTYTVDEDGDGAPEEIVWASYDADGQMVQRAWDGDGDGIWEEDLLYGYDADSGLLMTLDGVLMDPTYGAIDMAAAYTRDAGGRPLTYTADYVYLDYGFYPWTDVFTWTWYCE